MVGLRRSLFRQILLKELKLLKEKLFPSHFRREGKPLSPPTKCFFSTPSGRKCLQDATETVKVDNIEVVDREMGIYRCVADNVRFHVIAQVPDDRLKVWKKEIPLCEQHANFVRQLRTVSETD